ncbi:hypothetical protein BJX63DRAFT_405271 [Aspergillus granulosus]|uniref:Secreted protein n=1 Tax=Aspergillus granulosus TaxID=176169 RepID=A0ABR4H3T3_9EURO
MLICCFIASSSSGFSSLYQHMRSSAPAKDIPTNHPRHRIPSIEPDTYHLLPIASHKERLSIDYPLDFVPILVHPRGILHRDSSRSEQTVKL